MSGHSCTFSTSSLLVQEDDEEIVATVDHNNVVGATSSSSLLSKKRKLDPESVQASDAQDSNGSWQNQAMDYHLPQQSSSTDHQCFNSDSRSVIFDARCSGGDCPISPESPSTSGDELLLGFGEDVSKDGGDVLTKLCQPKDLKDWLTTFHGWTNTERQSALEALVMSEICDIQQLRFLLALIEPQLQRDFISLLPKELSLYVLSFLDPKDLLRAAQTCRYWRILCEDNLLWREKCKEEGLLEDQETIADLFRKRIKRRKTVAVSTSRGHNHSNNSSGSSCSSSLHSQSQSVGQSQSVCQSQSVGIPFIPSEYKLGYLRQKSIEFNWRYGKFPSDVEAVAASSYSTSTGPLGRKGRYLKEILHLKGHDDHVITCLQFNPASNLIVSGSDDNTLKVWSSSSGKCLRTLTGHTGGVWSSQLSPADIVISGSTDRTLKVWNAISGECLHSLYGHTSTVRCMALHGNHVVSGSRDATLRVWDITTGVCQHVLVGHVAAVRCVQFDGRIVVSGAYDYLVKVWDAHSELCLHTLEGHTNRVYSLQFDGESIVSGSLDTSIRVWSAKAGVLRHTLVGHQSLTSGMQLRGNVLVSGNADSTVKVWDITTGQCLQTLAGPNKHLSAVTCLQFNSRFVITSSDDGTVKLWDLETGEFIRNLVSLSSGGAGGVVWRIRASNTRLVCAVGSRNGTEETKLLVLDFDSETETLKPQRLPFSSHPMLPQTSYHPDDDEMLDDLMFMDAASDADTGSSLGQVEDVDGEEEDGVGDWKVEEYQEDS